MDPKDQEEVAALLAAEDDAEEELDVAEFNERDVEAVVEEYAHHCSAA